MNQNFLIFDKNANPSLRGRFAGKAIFSMQTGPSLNSLDYLQLSNKYTLAIKKLPLTHVKPTIWLCMEKSQDFPAEIWEDKLIIKLVTQEVYDKGYMKPSGDFIHSKPVFRMEPVSNTKNTYWFKLAQNYVSSKYFSDNAVQWGMASERKDEHGILGRRSIMLAHFRLMHYLGFKRIYLLGVDFDMQQEEPYCYQREKSPIAIYQNNLLYEALTTRLETLYPIMLQHGLEVFNCNLNSKLKVFPYMSYEEALDDQDTHLHRN